MNPDLGRCQHLPGRLEQAGGLAQTGRAAEGATAVLRALQREIGSLAGARLGGSWAAIGSRFCRGIWHNRAARA